MEAQSNHEGGSVSPRELLKLRLMIEALAGDTQRSMADLSRQISDVREPVADLSEITAELTRIRADRSVQEREIKQMEDSLVLLFDSIFRTLTFDLNSEFRAGVESILDNLKRILEPTGFRVIAPREGDEYDSRIHGIERRLDTNTWTISAVRSWGYQTHRGIIRPALVVLGPISPQVKPAQTDSPGGIVPTLDHVPSRRITLHRIMEFAAIPLLLMIGYFWGSFEPKAPEIPIVSQRNPGASFVLPSATDTPVVMATASPLLTGDTSEPDHPVSIDSVPEPIAEIRFPVIRVRKGDTLWNLSETWYGDGNKYPIVISANQLRSDNIVPGQELLFPGASQIPFSTNAFKKEAFDGR